MHPPRRFASPPSRGAMPVARRSRFHGILGGGTRSGNVANARNTGNGRGASLLAALLMGSALGLAQAGDMPTYRLTAREGRFEPAELVVPQGAKFRLEITNAGRDPVEFESLELRKEKVLAPGVTSSLVFRPLDAGRYRFFDDFHQTTGQGAIVAK
ncbi:cupredoxin domain-containing protein [Hydrogenophaga sp.]|uniref:cupredoxin domain-containing protein n=1 Tax=Hydrogenophaga sp. TaxID=1904254 RepID=UPI00351DF6CA